MSNLLKLFIILKFEKPCELTTIQKDAKTADTFDRVEDKDSQKTGMCCEDTFDDLCTRVYVPYNY